jgi:glycosyltransferase involved in cell wall biosynthesis
VPAAARSADSSLEVFLFLPCFYQGGVWEATKSLVHSLVEINARRHQLALVLGLHADQTDTAGLRQLGSALRVERLRADEYILFEARQILGDTFVYPEEPQRTDFCGWSGQNYPALRADAWFVLLDRFHLPLLPARPYGVWVYDMIQRHAPEVFDETFLNNYHRGGMGPTLRHASAVVTTNPATRQDVLDEYGVAADRVRLIPLAWEPHVRFGKRPPEPVPLPREPFLLYPANTAPHKGAEVMVRAYARLKSWLGSQTPLLVQCGVFSSAFSVKHHALPSDPPHWGFIRSLVQELGLEEGKDIVFLGFVSDPQLHDLYKRCAAVVNAGKYDNGSYALIEGRYFGRPLISTAYLAAVALCERFQLPVRFFPIDDDATLAQVLYQAIHESPLSGAALEEVRRQLAEPEFSLRCHAERVYDLLVELAQKGRRQRQAGAVAPRATHSAH